MEMEPYIDILTRIIQVILHSGETAPQQGGKWLDSLDYYDSAEGRQIILITVPPIFLFIPFIACLNHFELGSTLVQYFTLKWGFVIFFRNLVLK